MLKGIILLQKVKKKALRGIGCHTPRRCPISSAYNIGASGSWDTLTSLAKKRMFNYGWTALEYDKFIEWYDATDCGWSTNYITARERRSNELRELLS